MAIDLTDKLTKTLPAPDKGSKITYDTKERGLGVRVTAAGARAFIFNYRTKTGTERRYTIGDATAQTVADARRRAKELRREVDGGGDPMADLHAIRSAPIVADLADRFEAEHLTKRRPATVRDYTAMLRLYIRPELGTKKVDAVRGRDVELLHAKIATAETLHGKPHRPAPYMANRVVAVLSKMFALAIKWEMRSDNPAIGVERAPEEKRQRFLSPAEIVRLSEALAAHPEAGSANAVRLLLLTGARRGEVLSATWDQFDLGNGVWSKPPASTKQKRDHRIPLSAPAMQLLSGMKAEADQENARRERDGLPPIEHVFPGVNGQSLGDVKHFWAAVCKKADLQGVRVHDLRHTYASILASSGLSLPIIGALLGHTQASTTQRYAHLMDDPLRAATERAGAVITGAGLPGADVVPIGRGR
jgi:integrase